MCTPSHGDAAPVVTVVGDVLIDLGEYRGLPIEIGFAGQYGRKIEAETVHATAAYEMLQCVENERAHHRFRGIQLIAGTAIIYQCAVRCPRIVAAIKTAQAQRRAL